MFLDDLAADGVELAPLDSTEVQNVTAWFAAAFWTWYAIHAGDEIVSFSILGISVRKWHYADLHKVFVYVFGPEPIAAPESDSTGAAV